MMNKEIAIIGALALIVSGSVGIILALLGFSYWALAWQQIAYITTLNLGRYYYVNWRPRLTLDFAPVRQMAPFAMKILVTKIINTTSNNVLTVIFGRLFPMAQVGNYSQAFKWDTMAHSLITNTVGQLAQPVLVESDSQLRVYRKMIRFTAFLSMPLMFGLALVSREFILITIGSVWLGCVPLLQLLCLSGAFMPLHTMYQNLAISNGRSDIFMWLNILQILLQVTLIILIAPYGMYLMVAAYSLFIFLWLLPWHLFTGRLIAYRWWDAFKDVAPFAAISLAVMLITWFVTQPIHNIWFLLPAKVMVAAFLYYAIMKLLHVQILRECEAFFKARLHK
jgi:O-antigen/teichoic acid export membrane protein